MSPSWVSWLSLWLQLLLICSASISAASLFCLLVFPGDRIFLLLFILTAGFSLWILLLVLLLFFLRRPARVLLSIVLFFKRIAQMVLSIYFFFRRMNRVILLRFVLFLVLSFIPFWLGLNLVSSIFELYSFLHDPFASKDPAELQKVADPLQWIKRMTPVCLHWMIMGWYLLQYV